MVFNSWEFLAFFPIVAILYFVMPKKAKTVWLLIASYFFYVCWNPKYIVVLLFSTAVTYGAGLWLDYVDKKAAEEKKQKHKKLIIAGSCVINLGILAFFKYSDFFFENLNLVLQKTAGISISNPFDFVLPLGISFFTFQAIGYLIDVYRKDVEPERNIIRFALFLSFFPKIIQGPIERSKGLLKEIREIPQKTVWNYKRITGGLILMLWGLFLKLVISDRLSSMVDMLFNKSSDYSTPMLWVGAIGFAIQLYCDFAGYSIIAVGASKVLGLSIIDNFDTPYFSRSVKEFWRRWHISLSTWFRDYLYIPLGGNRVSTFRKYLNLMIVFLVSGIWHGAGWTFIIWGGLHGLFQIIGELLKPARKGVIKALQIKTDSHSHKIFQTLFTSFLVVIAWVFFRATSLGQAVQYLKGMFTLHITKPIFNGLEQAPIEWVVLLISIIILFAVSLIKYNMKMNLDEYLDKQSLWFRWIVLFILLFGLIIFGVYGPGFSAQAFIYTQF